MKATEKKPISVEDAVTHLAKKFPDRDPDKMKKTTVGQFSYFFPKKEGLSVQNIRGKGYYVGDAPAEEKSSKKSKKEDKKAKKKSKDEDDD
jgi:hypothetical protein